MVGCKIIVEDVRTVGLDRDRAKEALEAGIQIFGDGWLWANGAAGKREWKPNNDPSAVAKKADFLTYDGGVYVDCDIDGCEGCQGFYKTFDDFWNSWSNLTWLRCD